MAKSQLASAIVMVEPRDFAYNPETALDNAFQHHPDESNSQVRLEANREFWAMVERLDQQGIEVITLESPPEVNVPDAIFPNNWFITTDDSLLVFPMKASNRQDEVQIDNLVKQLEGRGFVTPKVCDLRADMKGMSLEGTGSMVFYHPENQVFANLSERCDLDALERFGEQFNYDVWPLEATSNSLVPIYHTNVMLSCGVDFTVLVEECLLQKRINDSARQKLHELYTDIITITETQMTENFCGNILQLQSLQGVPIITLSESAYQGFDKAQIKRLEKHGALSIHPIETIEYVGGGSVRCMQAEIFLEKVNSDKST